MPPPDRMEESSVNSIYQTAGTNCTILDGMPAVPPFAPHPHLERRCLVVPGLRSTRIHIVDTKPDPTKLKIVKIIEPEKRVNALLKGSWDVALARLRFRA
jgi:selenium binding protein SBP56